MVQKLKIITLLLLLSFTCIAYAQKPDSFRENYALKEMVVLSRHNIRSPLSGNGSALGKMTPHPWFKWTSGKSELSLRGGELETMMGQYFRKWLAQEKLFEENAIPSSKEIRFYTNSMQRTIATAQYFSSGMFPVANVKIEHHFPLNQMDPVFKPQLTFSNEPFRKLAYHQIEQMDDGRGLQGIGQSLSAAYALLEDILDLKDSELAKTEGKNSFRTDDTEIILNAYEEPAMKGSMKLATQASDAFILQYYEEPDPVKAAFGHKLTLEDWEKIASVKDVYGDVLFTAPAVAVNVANPLLKLIKKELALKKRKFTFLCGHDSNIGSLLAALEAKPYFLPQSIEKKTPIGSKLVFSKWVNKNGEQFVSIDLVYQTTEQLRERTLLSLDNPPVVFPITLENMQPNQDGLYTLKDINARFDKAIRAYKDLRK